MVMRDNISDIVNKTSIFVVLDRYKQKMKNNIIVMKFNSVIFNLIFSAKSSLINKFLLEGLVYDLA